MAIGRELKRQKEREEREKARRREVLYDLHNEEIREYRAKAQEAARARDFKDAISWAMKVLKLDPDDAEMINLAARCAVDIGDQETLYFLYRKCFLDGTLRYPAHFLSLGRMALQRKQYKLAKDALEYLLDRKSTLPGQITRTQEKEALRNLEQVLEHLNPAPRKKPEPSAPAAATGEAGAVEAVALQGEHSSTGAVQEALPELKIVFETDGAPVLEAVNCYRRSDPQTLELALKAYRLSFRTSYDQLICLPSIHNVQSLWYQEETARKVMKTFRGRTILADEVGLGKTVEAGIVLKEYIMRGLVRTALILTPSSLVHQWQGELRDKFDIPCVSTNDPAFKEDPGRFWEEPFILASIQTAKTKRHFDLVTSRSYDMVIVDEAHHLKNRTTLNWKLVNAIQKTFLLMLTATPVQNSLEELYNLVTLLRPGHLKTQKAFKEEFVTRGNPTDPRNREKLRELLKEVMIRNTRSVTQLHLPPRFALTVRINPTQAEEAFYRAVSSFVTEGSSASGSGGSGKAKASGDADPAAAGGSSGTAGISKIGLRRLLEAAGSSHMAALRSLERMDTRGLDAATKKRVAEIIGIGKQIRMGNKVGRVLELLKASSEQKIIFVNYIATLEYLGKVLKENGIPHVVFQGSMTSAQKREAIEEFRKGKQVLLATGTGGEGHNLQFCHMMINFDLPWNPMEIEQRIGRIHRIGQEKDVQVYNFCAAGSLEDHILDVLDRKINMFELVVGEIDMILGRLQGEEEFSDLVYEIWVRHPDEAERKKAFDALASRLKRARSAYEKSKELDEKLFQEDFGI